jgi:hypothetical protein
MPPLTSSASAAQTRSIRICSRRGCSLHTDHDRPRPRRSASGPAAAGSRDDLGSSSVVRWCSRAASCGVLATYFGRIALEIAELERVPLGTVKTRIRVRMLKLSEALELSDAR